MRRVDAATRCERGSSFVGLVSQLLRWRRKRDATLLGDAIRALPKARERLLSRSRFVCAGSADAGIEVQSHRGDGKRRRINVVIRSSEIIGDLIVSPAADAMDEKVRAKKAVVQSQAECAWRQRRSSEHAP